MTAPVCWKKIAFKTIIHQALNRANPNQGSAQVSVKAVPNPSVQFPSVTLVFSLQGNVQVGKTVLSYVWYIGLSVKNT